MTPEDARLAESRLIVRKRQDDMERRMQEMEDQLEEQQRELDYRWRQRAAGYR